MFSYSKLNTTQNLLKLFVVIRLIWCHGATVSNNMFNYVHGDKMAPDYEQVIDASGILTCVRWCIGQSTFTCKAVAFDEGNDRCYLYNRVLFYEEPSTGQIGLKTYTLTPGYNIARYKPSTMSSVYNGWSSYSSKKGLDGKFSTYFHTKVDQFTWWCVDLGQIVHMESLIIYNRQRHGHRIKGFDIRFSKDGSCTETGAQSAEICYKDTASVQMVYSIYSCNKVHAVNFTARYVYVTVQDKFLHFNEMMIYI